MKKRSIAVVGGALAIALGVLFAWRSATPSGPRLGAAARSLPETSASAVERPKPRRAPRTLPRPPAPAVREAAASARDVEPTTAPAPAPQASPSAARVQMLTTSVMQKAVRENWVVVDEHDNACPPDRIRIVYDVPSDLGGYTKGAYFEPLGPAPGDSADEVNGLLLCEGSTFFYRGFEAYYRADRGYWDVYPFPVVE